MLTFTPKMLSYNAQNAHKMLKMLNYMFTKYSECSQNAQNAHKMLRMLTKCSECSQNSQDAHKMLKVFIDLDGFLKLKPSKPSIFFRRHK